MRTLPLFLLLSTAALAQGVPQPPRAVSILGRVTTDIANTWVPVAGGADGERLEVSLDAATLDSITTATALGNCTYTDGNPAATIGTTAANIPASPMASRTAITIWNHSTAPAQALICSASGTATATHGLRIEAQHQWWKWQGLGAGVTISCRCLLGTCTYGVLEERCYQ